MSEEPEITLGAEVVVIGIDRTPVDLYRIKKSHIGKVGKIIVIENSLKFDIPVEARYLVRFGEFGSVDKHYFYERNLSLDLSLAEDYPATDKTIIPNEVVKKAFKKFKNTKIRKRNPKRR